MNAPSRDRQAAQEALARAFDEAVDSLLAGGSSDEEEESPYWCSFDFDGQTIDALRHVCELLPRTTDDRYLWKWVVIAMFDAMHGFFGLALRRGDGAQLLSERHERRTYRRWEAERNGHVVERKPDRVDETRDLFQKIQEPTRMSHFVESSAFSPTDGQKEAFEYIAHLRDRLTHYGHGSRVVSIAELPERVLKTLSIIEWLVEQSRTITLFPQELGQAREIIQRVKYEANRLISLCEAGETR
jgi:hypothetical protein